ncbi:MAG: tyrosine-type recombinase/integrase [Fuerstiella sp.]
MVRSAFFAGPLYEKMSEDLHLTGKAKRTHDGYLREIRKLAEFCQLPPDQISEAQMRRWFLHLKNQKHFAAGSLTVTLSALKFFYRTTCPRNWISLEQLKVKGPRTLPEVITIRQVNRIIDACTTERMAVFFWTLYSLGLRLDEGLNLQVGDVDAARSVVHIHRGKGAKDRYLPLPSSTLQLLRQHWKSHRHERLLFPADGRNHRGMSTASTPMAPTTPQDAMKLITTQLKFGKKVSCHTLRHSYATHLFEAGVSLKNIQKYLGHSSLQTTLVYIHITETAEADARQAVERLFRRTL